MDRVKNEDMKLIEKLKVELKRGRIDNYEDVYDDMAQNLKEVIDMHRIIGEDLYALDRKFDKPRTELSFYRSIVERLLKSVGVEHEKKRFVEKKP